MIWLLPYAALNCKLFSYRGLGFWTDSFKKPLKGKKKKINTQKMKTKLQFTHYTALDLAIDI